MTRAALVVALLTACSVALPACRKAPDAVAIAIIDGRAYFTSRIDPQGRTWLVASPGTPRTHEGPASSVLCRLEGAAMTCGVVPGTEITTRAITVGLTDAGPGASPLVIVEQDKGYRYLEPFTWRELHRLPGPTGHDNAVAYADGTLLVELDDDALGLLAPNTAPRRIELPQRASSVHVSRFGVIWQEAVDERWDAFRLVSATLDGDRLVNVREHGPTNGWLDACRDGDLFAYRNRTRGENDPHLVVVDVASGKRHEVAPLSIDDVVCRPGEVAGLTLFREDWYCTKSGCQPTRTEGRLANLSTSKSTLVEGGLLHVKAKREEDAMETIVWRVGEASRTLRVANSDDLTDLAAVRGGALILYENGAVHLVDHRGAPKPLTVTWSQAVRSKS